MKKQYLTFFLAIFLLISYSCKKEIRQNQNNSDYKIEITDSLKLDFASAIISDVTRGNMLFYNHISNEIGVYNFENKKTTTINKFGSSPDEFSFGLDPQTLKFVNDTLIGLSDVSLVKLYNFKGEFIKDVNLDGDDSYAQITNFEFVKDSLFIGLKAPEGNNSLQSFYEQDHKLLMKKNLKNDDLEYFAKFPLKNSDFNNKDFYYPYLFTYYNEFNLEESKYSFVNSNDSYLYSFDVNTNKMIEDINLNMDNYNRLKKPFSSNRNSESRHPMQGIIDIYTNSIINGFSNTKKYDYITYAEAIDENIVKEHLEKNPFGNPNSEPLIMNNWIHTIENGKKIRNDILVPKNIGLPIKFFSDDYIIFSGKPVSEQDDLNGVSTYYIGKIVKTTEQK